MKVEVNILFLIETMRFSFGLMMKCTNMHMIGLRDFSFGWRVSDSLEIGRHVYGLVYSNVRRVVRALSTRMSNAWGKKKPMRVFWGLHGPL